MSSPGRILSPIFIILWLGTWAQHKIPVYAKRCPVKTINYEEGLMDNSITAVITDAEGFTWVSTSTGIQRYNGYTLQPITPVVTGDTIRIDYPVFFLKEKDNTLLIGYREGILGFSHKNESPSPGSFSRTCSVAGPPHFPLPAAPARIR